MTLSPLFVLCLQGVEINPRFNRGKIKKLCKRKTSKYNGKCLTTHNLYAASDDKLLLETIQENQRELDSIEKILDNEIKTREELRSIYNDNELIKNLRQKWDSMTNREKHKAIDILIKKITLTDGKIKIEYKV